jgi:F-type H+-transporting ATPase subunit b
MPRIGKILESRRQRIEGSISRAEELNYNAQQVRQEFEAFLNMARNQAHENVMKMIHNVTVTNSQRKKDLNSMMLERIQSSEERIARKKTQALSDIKDIAEGIAVVTVEKLIAQKIDRKSVGKVMNELFSQKVV